MLHISLQSIAILGVEIPCATMDQDVISASNEHFELIPGGSAEWILTPVFVDSANGDYRLVDYSPGIGNGELSYPLDNDNLILNAPTEDLVGNVVRVLSNLILVLTKINSTPLKMRHQSKRNPRCICK